MNLEQPKTSLYPRVSVLIDQQANTIILIHDMNRKLTGVAKTEGALLKLPKIPISMGTYI